nr:uncharacterized protein LOC109169793 [Ipomoea batatas]
MFNPFICGSSHLHVDEDDMDVLSPCSTPKRSKKDKKQKIYTQVGAEDISIVRFVFPANSDDVKPIVVKFKGKKESAGRDDNRAAKTGGLPEKVEVEKREKLLNISIKSSAYPESVMIDLGMTISSEFDPNEIEFKRWPGDQEYVSRTLTSLSFLS